MFGDETRNHEGAHSRPFTKITKRTNHKGSPRGDHSPGVTASLGTAKDRPLIREILFALFVLAKPFVVLPETDLRGLRVCGEAAFVVLTS
jgi:hypothetical protein